MADIAFTKSDNARSWRVYFWETVGQSDTPLPVKLDRTPYSLMVQATGTFSGSAAIAVHGSVDGTNYVALDDRQGTAISLTAAGIASIGEAPLWIKPVVSSGDGSTDVDVSILVRFDGP